MAKGGKRPGAGRKPVWDTEVIRGHVDRVSPLWWKEIEKMLKSKNPGQKRFAMTEFNKLQVKAMPQKLAGDDDGEPINIRWISPSPTNPESGPPTSIVHSDDGLS